MSSGERAFLLIRAMRLPTSASRPETLLPQDRTSGYCLKLPCLAVDLAIRLTISSTAEEDAGSYAELLLPCRCHRRLPSSHPVSSAPATVQKKRLTVMMSIAKYSNALVVGTTSASGSWPIGRGDLPWIAI